MSDQDNAVAQLKLLVGDVDEIKRRLVDLQSEAEKQTRLLKVIAAKN